MTKKQKIPKEGVKEDRYAIRKVNGKFKAIKFNPKTMELRQIPLYGGAERNERTYSKEQVEKLRRKSKKDKSMEPVIVENTKS